MRRSELVNDEYPSLINKNYTFFFQFDVWFSNVLLVFL